MFRNFALPVAVDIDSHYHRMVHFDMWTVNMAVEDLPIDRTIVDYMDLNYIAFERIRS